MATVSSDEILQNIKKVTDKYQEIMLLLLRGKGSIIPRSLIDNDKTMTMMKNIYEQCLANPEKFLKLNAEYTRQFTDLVSHSITRFIGQDTEALYKPDKRDRRFKDPAWQENIYFDFVKQFYLMSVEWAGKTVDQYELDHDLKKYLEFTSRQFLNALSPTNFIFYNPLVLKESLNSGWQNIVRGLDNFLEDIKKSGDVLNISTTDKTFFKIGQNIATAPGKVIYQNDLMQLICYSPAKYTYSLPILIIPSWINKYYILDLSSHNSMVKWLVENNFQVFIISWNNPDYTLKDKNFENYLQEGMLEAYENIAKLGYTKINTAGYCIGGTLLASGLAYLKAHNLNYVNSASFFTTLLDFTNPGEVAPFINESAISAIEVEMEKKGYFDGRYLSNSFNLLRANDLVWSFFVNNYLLGKTPMPFDILFWNADPVNLPAKMHSYYLRNMYLNNQLKVPGNLKLLDTPIDLSKIDNSSFFVAASGDHIAEWKAVYEGSKLLTGDKTFCLTASGHVVGIVNPPCNAKYGYQINNDLTLNAEEWQLNAIEKEGSWWSYWKEWLVEKSGPLTQSIEYANLSYIEPAPGSYVKK